MLALVLKYRSHSIVFHGRRGRCERESRQRRLCYRERCSWPNVKGQEKQRQLLLVEHCGTSPDSGGTVLRTSLPLSVGCSCKWRHIARHVIGPCSTPHCIVVVFESVFHGGCASVGRSRGAYLVSKAKKGLTAVTFHDAHVSHLAGCGDWSWTGKSHAATSTAVSEKQWCYESSNGVTNNGNASSARSRKETASHGLVAAFEFHGHEG